MKAIEYLKENVVKALEIFNKSIRCTPNGKCTDCETPSLCSVANAKEIKEAIKGTTFSTPIPEGE